MSTVHSSSPASPPRRRPEVIPEKARALTMWAWIMLPVALVAMLVAGVLGYLFMALLDVAEGDMLTSAGALGWGAMFVVVAVMAAPLVAGTLLGGRAMKLGGGGTAAAACVVNALGLLFVLFPAGVVDVRRLTSPGLQSGHAGADALGEQSPRPRGASPRETRDRVGAGRSAGDVRRAAVVVRVRGGDTGRGAPAARGPLARGARRRGAPR